MKVLLFSSAREAAGGASEIDWPWAFDRPTLRSLLEDLEDAYPALRRVLPHARLAVNGSYVRPPLGSVRLERSDEVAILPPYSGG